MVKVVPKVIVLLNIWEIQERASMTILTLEQYKSATKLCERLLNNNSTVRPSDASVLGFPIEYEALARYIRTRFHLVYYIYCLLVHLPTMKLDLVNVYLLSRCVAVIYIMTMDFAIITMDFLNAEKAGSSTTWVRG